MIKKSFLKQRLYSYIPRKLNKLEPRLRGLKKSQKQVISKTLLVTKILMTLNPQVLCQYNWLIRAVNEVISLQLIFYCNLKEN